MIDEVRLPAHLEVAGLIRRTQSEGGFAAVLKKGDLAAGVILVVLTENGSNTRLYERMPQATGARKWLCTKTQDIDNKAEFSDYLERRGKQDSDLWIIELDVAEGERFIL